jgi:catalase
MTNDSAERPPTTNDAGVPVASQEHSLTVGPDGPILLQDFYLIEQMANFNRERIPERQPHAKGGGPYGTFTVTHDVSRYSRRLVSNVAGALSRIKRREVLDGAFEYWRNIDKTIGDSIQAATTACNPTVQADRGGRRTAR